MGGQSSRAPAYRMRFHKNADMQLDLIYLFIPLIFRLITWPRDWWPETCNVPYSDLVATGCSILQHEVDRVITTSYEYLDLKLLSSNLVTCFIPKSLRFRCSFPFQLHGQVSGERSYKRICLVSYFAWRRKEDELPILCIIKAKFKVMTHQCA
jgi:hypothetical protein